MKKKMMMMTTTTVTTMVMMESKSAENIQNDAGPRRVDLPLNCASGAQCFVSAEILATKSMTVFSKPP
jgi:hypothetical protein